MRKRFINTSARGFTLTELLIVIIIIGILGSLVSVGYIAYLQRANNSQTATAAQAYINALNLYRNEHGSYPNPSLFPEGFDCLGTGYAAQTCVIQSSAPSPIKESTSLTTALAPYFNGGKTPIAGSYVYHGSGHTYSGGYYLSDVAVNNWELDGPRYPWFIVYFQQGATTKCPVGPVVSYTGGSGLSMQFSSGVPSQGYTLQLDSAVTMCVIALAPIPATP